MNSPCPTACGPAPVDAEHDPRLPNYDRLWQGAWGDQQKYGPVARHQRRIYNRLLAEHVPEGVASICDVGCGEGTNLAAIARRFPRARLYGTDVAEGALELARSRLPAVTFLRNSILERAPDIEPCDLVLNFDVLEHLEDDRAALANMRALCRRYLLVSTVTGTMGASELEIGHFRNYTADSLGRLVEEAGFRIVHAVNWGWPFYSPLMRALGETRSLAPVATGRFGPAKRLIAAALYALYFLNSWQKGDRITVLARCRDEQQNWQG